METIRILMKAVQDLPQQADSFEPVSLDHFLNFSISAFISTTTKGQYP